MVEVVNRCILKQQGQDVYLLPPCCLVCCGKKVFVIIFRGRCIPMGCVVWRSVSVARWGVFKTCTLFGRGGDGGGGGDVRRAGTTDEIAPTQITVTTCYSSNNTIISI